MVVRPVRQVIFLLPALALLLAACAPAAAPSPTAAPAKPAATAAPAKPAEKPAATAAPAKPAPTAAAKAEEKPATGEPYKIGAIFDITGGGSSLGVPERDTIKMLEAEVNARGGIKGPDGKLHPVQVVLYDNQSQESQSVLVAKRLIEEDKVPVILGATQSGTTLAMVDTIQKAQVPLISAAASIRIVEPVAEHKWVFKTPQSDVLIHSVLVEYLKAKGLTRVAWMSVNNAFGDSGRDEFQKAAPAAGIQIVANERFGAEDKDMSAQLTKIRGTDANALIIWAIPPAASVATKNAADLGIKIPVFQSHGIGNQDFITLAGPAANGVVFPVGKLLVADSLADSDAQKKVLLDYTAAYQKAYGKGPTTFGGHAWDCFWIAVRAMEKAGPNPSAIRDQLEQIKDFVGITGVFNFSPQDHNGLDRRAVTMVKIVDGKWKATD
ncbi:MAG: ABC transporter substrate-binding protein [Chloroflexi bacterium]|nr:ABC transporter substrate-binding protein [Chloroflexota bacterium]